jgi:hypothetical protein
MKLGSGETGMNLYVHTRTMKIVPIRRTPSSGPLRDTEGRVFFKKLLIRRGGALFWGGGIHRTT